MDDVVGLFVIRDLLIRRGAWIGPQQTDYLAPGVSSGEIPLQLQQQSQNCMTE